MITSDGPDGISDDQSARFWHIAFIRGRPWRITFQYLRKIDEMSNVANGPILLRRNGFADVYEAFKLLNAESVWKLRVLQELTLGHDFSKLLSETQKQKTTANCCQ